MSGADPMPVFTMKAKDLLALTVIAHYRNACASYGLHDQAAQVDLAMEEFRLWREAHPDQIRFPDHKHVPASGISVEETDR